MSAPVDPAVPVLEVDGLRVDYRLAGGAAVRAVDRVGFSIGAGETLALVGESGCGKSTVARAVMRLVPVEAGSIRLEGVELTTLDDRALRPLRPRFQLIFQDPISSLNPRRTVRELLAAPLRYAGRDGGAAARQRIAEALVQVGLDPADALDRHPHEFSGGQCQRISIARALLLEPTLLVCDEPVSALDVSIRAQVLNILNDLRARLGLAMLFISHDLSVVRNVADRIAVMYLGRLCEIGPAAEVLERPAHPYGAALISAVPHLDGGPGGVIRLRGEMPSPLALPSGCHFRTRCPAARPRCAEEEPPLAPLPDGRRVACHFPFAVAPPARRRVDPCPAPRKVAP